MTAAAQPVDLSKYAWVPQGGPQGHGIACAGWCEELFFGGAVFGGKTDFLLGDFAQDIDQGSDWVGALFRQTRPEFEDLIERSHEIYPHLGGIWLAGKSTWRFPGPRGEAILRMRHMEDEKDFQRYMGWSLSWIGWDELGNWPSMRPYNQMKSRLRGRAQRKRIRSTGNPGGLSHQEIKDYWFIDGENKDGYAIYHDPVTDMRRMFIPSRVEDNVIGLAADPGYLGRLEGIGDPELVRAWKGGDWNATVGAYFSMYRPAQNECEPFEIPDGWGIFTCGDYGESNPCWWGIICTDFDDEVWVIDEYFRADAGGRDHARGVKAMVDDCPFIPHGRPRLNLAPADMWTQRKPGEASQAMAPADSFAAEGLHLTKANMSRVNGWRNLKDLLYPAHKVAGLLYGPRIHFFRGRTDNVQSSLSTVQRDPANVEDVLKGGNDHPADGLRYGVNHVYKPRRRPSNPPAVGTGEHVIQQLQQMGTSKTRYG